MSNYARIIDGLVVNLETASSDWVNELPNKSEYVEITETTGICYIGGDYLNGRFYSKQPFPSWTRLESGDWVPPTPYPNDDTIFYKWSEKDLFWIPILN